MRSLITDLWLSDGLKGGWGWCWGGVGVLISDSGGSRDRRSGEGGAGELAYDAIYTVSLVCCLFFGVPFSMEYPFR